MGMCRAEQRRAEEGRGGIGYLSKCVVSSIGKDVATLPPTPFLTYSILSQNKPEKEKKRKHTQTSKDGRRIIIKKSVLFRSVA